MARSPLIDLFAAALSLTAPALGGLMEAKPAENKKPPVKAVKTSVEAKASSVAYIKPAKKIVKVVRIEPLWYLT